MLAKITKIFEEGKEMARSERELENMRNLECLVIDVIREEIQEIVSKCNKCGLCKELDPVFKVLREESISARGKVILFSKGIFDKNLFDYSLDGSCKQQCPFNIDLDRAVRKARQILNLKGRENPDNKKIFKKVKNRENPYSE